MTILLRTSKLRKSTGIVKVPLVIIYLMFSVLQSDNFNRLFVRVRFAAIEIYQILISNSFACYAFLSYF